MLTGQRVGNRPRIGLAYAAYVPELASRYSDLIDYVEIPFERLRHDAIAADLVGEMSTILHCASLSIAGLVPASDQITDDVKKWAARMRTPWIGEHLAFTTVPGTGDERINVGYTVAPPLNDSSLRRVVDACAQYERVLGSQIILENPPQYFVSPGSTMNQIEYIDALCEQSKVELLFDISHFLITARNFGIDPTRGLARLPLQRVREVHISGLRYEKGTYWDDHGTTAPKEAFVLLRSILEVAHPEAITLEYNWSAAFPESLVMADVERVHRIVSQACCV